MSRKTKKAPTRRRVTDTVTDRHPEHDLHQHADDGGPVPEAANDNDDVLEATAMAASRIIGKIEGIRTGLSAPRNASEQRVLDQTPAIAAVLQEVFIEARKAVGKHAPQNSPHEGYAVLLEEVDELWAEIKADRGRQKSARAEAVQVAAMAVRYVLDNDPR